MKKVLFVLLSVTCIGCSTKSETEKYQDKRDNIIDVRDRLKEIVIEDVLIGEFANFAILGNHLIISDNKGYDKLIHIFDKHDFHYITSTAEQGQGPNEITTLGHIEPDEERGLIYASDHGKQMIFSYNIDSVIKDPLYTHQIKLRINEGLIPVIYQYINDTLAIAEIFEIMNVGEYQTFTGKWNMKTGAIEPMKYKHPGIGRKRIHATASTEHGIYVECHFNYDLLSICTLDGDLKYNIYGRNWNQRTNPTDYYSSPVIIGNKILALYSGRPPFKEDVSNGLISNYPTKFHVFDLTGEYIKTMETEYEIFRYRYDKDNNRLIFSLNDEMQFAYLDLDGLI